MIRDRSPFITTYFSMKRLALVWAVNVKSALRKSFKLKGRSTRSEMVSFLLLFFSAQAVDAAIIRHIDFALQKSGLAGNSTDIIVYFLPAVLLYVCQICMLPAWLTVVVRRCHDIGLSSVLFAGLFFLILCAATRVMMLSSVGQSSILLSLKYGFDVADLAGLGICMLPSQAAPNKYGTPPCKSLS